MNWIKVKDKLPELHKSVLLWGEWGHRIQIVIGALHDLNGKDGYIELVGPGGFNTTQPNKEYSDNLEWSIGGHWREFKCFTDWLPLPDPPSDK